MVKRSDVGYFIFDVESAADGELIANVKYPGEALSPNKRSVDFEMNCSMNPKASGISFPTRFRFRFQW
jgi:hypothetical protein